MHQASRPPPDSLQPAPPRAAVGDVRDGMWGSEPDPVRWRSYFGFTKYASGASARDAYQIFYQAGNPASWSDARLVGEFDTLQLFDRSGVNAKIPLEKGGQGPGLEPFTRSYPEYGSGGAQQMEPSKPGTIVKFRKVTLNPEN